MKESYRDDDLIMFKFVQNLRSKVRNTQKKSKISIKSIYFLTQLASLVDLNKLNLYIKTTI